MTSPDVRAEFRRWKTAWETEALNLSSPEAMAETPSYREIIALGPAVVPCLIEALRGEPDHWFLALKRIAKADPVPPEDRGDIDRMAAAWIAWAADRATEGSR